MNRRRSPLLTLGAVLSLGLLSSTMAVAEGYYVGSVCNPQTPYEPSWYTDGPNLINGSAGTLKVMWGLPHKSNPTAMILRFSLQLERARMSIVRGLQRKTFGEVDWV